MFGYAFLLSTEVRFARKLGRYELLVDRPRWESVWPFFLIIVLLLTIATTDVLDWILVAPSPSVMAFIREQVLAPRAQPGGDRQDHGVPGHVFVGAGRGPMLLAFSLRGFWRRCASPTSRRTRLRWRAALLSSCDRSPRSAWRARYGCMAAR